MKYLFLAFFLVGCGRTYGMKVGMKVTNGYCTGQISQILTGQEIARILNPKCGELIYDFIEVPLKDLKEVQQ